MTPTRVALVGGNEFRRDCDAMDRTLLELAGSARPSVAILPTAAARENPRLAGHNGVRHFKRLGARAQAVMIVDRKTANQPELVAALEHSHLIYLTGGDAVHLLDSLSRSHAWDVMLARHAQGVVLVGSSAGAMVLGSQMRRPQRGGWVKALGIVPGVAVLPHHEDRDPAETVQPRDRPNRITRARTVRRLPVRHRRRREPVGSQRAQHPTLTAGTRRARGL